MVAARKTNQTKRSKVFLLAYDAKGQIIQRKVLSFDNYYEELHEIIDSSAYRAKKGIAKLQGKIYDSSATLLQEFETLYRKNGTLLKTKAIHRNGAVTQHEMPG
jgi:hypothetical protein